MYAEHTKKRYQPKRRPPLSKSQTGRVLLPAAVLTFVSANVFRRHFVGVAERMDA
jgi:hypothetical protein